MSSRVNQAELAARLWPHLVEKAAQRETVFYAEVAAFLRMHHRPVRFVLEQILNYCIETRKPLLTALVVTKATGKPGSGIKSRVPTFSEDELGEVFGWDWAHEPNPFEWALDGTTESDLKRLLLTTPSRAEDVYARVKVRGMMQIQFRHALLEAYGGVCCFSGIAIKEVLEAAHIIPWSCAEPHLRGSVSNGLLLSSLHHKLFENGLLTLNAELRIWCNEKTLCRIPQTDLMRHLVFGLHGKPIRPPKQTKWSPTPSLIEAHNAFLGLTPQF
jgi:putative restriction endonuclease